MAAKGQSEAQLMAAIAREPMPRLFLIFGPDETAAHAIASNLSKQLMQKIPDIERVDMNSEALKDDPAKLADEASSQSLFGDKRFIRLELKRDEAIGAVENFMDRETTQNVVIATAGNLTKASKLRKLAEKSPQVAFHICYQPGERELVPILMSGAKDKGLRLDRDLASQIAKACNYNRVLALTEIEKLSLYYDASPDNMVDAKSADFEKLSADAAADNLGDLVNALLSGNIKKSGEEILQARAIGLNAVSIIRALQRRITMLAGMRAQVDNGASPSDVASRNPAVFWKEKEIFAVQLSTWTSVRLAALITHLLAMETSVMAAKADFSAILLEQELMRICRAAAKARRNQY